jgi:hypothetical protein
MSIYSDTIFDSKPNWFDWSINSNMFASPREILIKEKITSLDINAFNQCKYSDVGTFREEVNNTAIQCVKKSNGRKIIVAVSGIDSEVIVRELAKLKANVEMVHMDIWYKNRIDLEIIKQISKELDIPLHVFTLNWNLHGKFIYKSLYETCVAATAMNCMNWLFSHFDKNCFFITGNGAFRKQGSRFETIGKKYNIEETTKKRGRMIPFDLRDICMRVMAQENQMHGEYYFHISNQREVAALFKNKKMKFNHLTGEIDDKEVYFEQFPECLFRHKTNPFERSNFISNEYRLVKLFCQRLKNEFPNWDPDNRLICGFLYVDEIFS